MKHIALFTAAAAIGLGISAPASADPFQFVITGNYSASFVLDSNPSPDAAFTGSYFTLWDVSGFPDAVAGVADVSFFNAFNGGGLAIEDFYGFNLLLLTDGPQLYSGTEANPFFKTGTFALSEYQGTGSYSLTISAVPEPVSWGLMITGFGLAGAALRRRSYKQGKISVAYAA
ncbi:PEPxxWA-CTERM sorting domain-containing protein [Sphingomonas pituitosa]|uniref:PEPxxWA-CTERM sorting domain-containing protein n=1 Tax=Sphingomonas pituitosa TaxID=99597 RepID=UPI000A93D1DE|nr:PEPxxWA-CTERM sorting domain-containing protein [Sphingomonas pituitosa]